MRPGDILSGLPFKTAARVAFGVLILLGLGGALLTYAVTGALHRQLQEQTLEEAVLLRDIYGKQGRDGLVGAIRTLDSFFDNQERVSAVFDETGARLVGPILKAPPFVGLRETSFERVSGERRNELYILSVQKVKDTTIVVGRSLKAIHETRDNLVSGMALLAVFITTGTLLLGVSASYRSFAKLQSIEEVLARVARGQTAERIPIPKKPDQIDRISAQINSNLERLSNLMDGMKATATAIAHDLKTPISHAQIALNKAADTCEPHPQALQDIETALRETSALNEIVDTILRIARIRASSPKRDFKSHNLTQLVRTTSEFLSPLAEDYAHEVAIEADPDHPVMLQCDKSMVQQMLVNLIKNAIVHSGDGAAVFVTLEESPDQVALIVSDTGQGVPADSRELVLGAFKRLDSARRDPGSGLGLALVAAVADHHGAVVDLSDAQTGLKDRPGLRITVTFPKAQQ